MTTSDDLIAARRALDIALAALVRAGDYIALHTHAAHLLTAHPGTPPAPSPLHETVTAAVREAHDTLDRTDPAVPDHPTARCVECGSPKVTYFNHREQPFCRVCADGRGPASQPLPAAVHGSPFPRCERCHMPHDPSPGGLAAQVCSGFFAPPVHADQEAK